MLFISLAILLKMIGATVLLTDKGENSVNCINSEENNSVSIIKKFEKNYRTNKRNCTHKCRNKCGCLNNKFGKNKKIMTKTLIERLDIFKNKTVDHSLEIVDLTRACDIAKSQKLMVYYGVLSYMHVIINNLAELNLLNLEKKLSFEKINDINCLANYNTEVLNVLVNLDKNLFNEKIDDLTESVLEIDERLSNFIFFDFETSYLNDFTLYGKNVKLDRIGECCDYSDLLKLYFYHLRNTRLYFNDLKDITIYLILFLDYDSCFFKISPKSCFKNFLVLKMILILKISKNNTLNDVEKIIHCVKDNANENFHLFMNVLKASSSLYDEIECNIQNSLKQNTYLGPLKILDHFQTYSILKPSNLSLKTFFFVLEDDECENLHALQNDLFRIFECLIDLISNKIY